MGNTKHISLCILIVLCQHLLSFAQSGAGCSGAPVFTQDFGTADSTTQGQIPSGFNTTYRFGGVSTDGHYIVTPFVQNAVKDDWANGGDHTRNDTVNKNIRYYKNMFLVNAGGNDSIFFSTKTTVITGLCQGSFYNFSARLANVDTWSTTGICGQG